MERCIPVHVAVIFEKNRFRARRRDPLMYSLFTFETFCNPYTRISKMIKEGVGLNLSSVSMLANVSKVRAEPKHLVRMSNAALRGCNLLLSAF